MFVLRAHRRTVEWVLFSEEGADAGRDVLTRIALSGNTDFNACVVAS